MAFILLFHRFMLNKLSKQLLFARIGFSTDQEMLKDLIDQIEEVANQKRVIITDIPIL
ncbi:MAG: hypothetical protein NZO16_05950 [Deltaproteobacteria bacterium]|nr:hypothetical protein [Deltaproteobacteria bacterium]